MITQSNERLDAGSSTFRIGVFSESFQPVQNGVTTSVQTLVSGLRSRRHKVWVFAPAHHSQQEPETDVVRFPSFVSSFNRGYPLAFPFIPRLALLPRLAKLRLDVVHTHTPFVLGLTGANLAISRQIPLVATFHTLYTQYTHYVPLVPDSVTHGVLDLYLPWYYNRCTEIICPSHIAERALRDHGVVRPIEVIPTGIPIPAPERTSIQARIRVRGRLRVSMAAPLLMYVGRLAPEKCVDMLIEAYVEVRRNLPESKLAILGSGSAEQALRDLARALGVEAGVVFAGPIPRRQLDSYYAASDVFCFPSPSETQGLVIGEARAAGTPCVVVDAGGAVEMVKLGEDGICTPAGDARAFSSAVVSLLKNPVLRAEMSTNAVRNAAEFTPECMVERVLNVYRRARLHPQTTGQHCPPSDGGELDWEVAGQSIRPDRTTATRR